MYRLSGRMLATNLFTWFGPPFKELPGPCKGYAGGSGSLPVGVSVADKEAVLRTCAKALKCMENGAWGGFPVGAGYSVVWDRPFGMVGAQVAGIHFYRESV